MMSVRHEDHSVDRHPHGRQEHQHGHGHANRHRHPTGLRGFLLKTFRPHSHDSADLVDRALESSSQGIRAIKISLIVLGNTAGAQALIVAVMGSVALLSDTIHNFSDALTAIPLWIAFWLGRRRPSRAYACGRAGHSRIHGDRSAVSAGRISVRYASSVTGCCPLPARLATPLGPIDFTPDWSRVP